MAGPIETKKPKDGFAYALELTPSYQDEAGETSLLGLTVGGGYGYKIEPASGKSTRILLNGNYTFLSRPLYESINPKGPQGLFSAGLKWYQHFPLSSDVSWGFHLGFGANNYQDYWGHRVENGGGFCFLEGAFCNHLGVIWNTYAVRKSGNPKETMSGSSFGLGLQLTLNPDNI